MTFKIMAYVTTVGGCLLGLRFIFAGASVLKEWGIEATDGPLVICRRIGALYLGLALMFFLGRTAAPSDLRSAVCLGVGGAIALIACLGLFEFWAKRVSSGIIVPASSHGPSVWRHKAGRHVRLCHASGGELEQIQFLLGHISVQTTERYLGCKQRIRSAVNDRIGLEPGP